MDFSKASQSKLPFGNQTNTILPEIPIKNEEEKNITIDPRGDRILSNALSILDTDNEQPKNPLPLSNQEV